MSAVVMQGDSWRGVLNDEWHVDDPSWDDVSRAIQRLDAKTFTMVTIQRPGEQHLSVGGGGGQYVVYATFDNGDFWNLVSRTVDDGTVLLNAGGQDGEYPARQIVDLHQAQTAARAFFENTQLEPSLCWQKQ